MGEKKKPNRRMLAVVGCADMEQAGESVPSRGHKILSGVKGQTD